MADTVGDGKCLLNDGDQSLHVVRVGGYEDPLAPLPEPSRQHRVASDAELPHFFRKGSLQRVGPVGTRLVDPSMFVDCGEFFCYCCARHA